ncbi:DNA topoisomerase 2-beta [Tyrophagus putrescentiae]|nr:DNA topoisomerase 2-beta [Tyrophagus putrescentiae]
MIRWSLRLNHAGKEGLSLLCTLILTEGDSAKALVVSGLGEAGRDRYGVFPLRGKLLNVREATHKQIMENKEINNIIKILGEDGSHIKGLLINFIHHFWPSLLKLNFLEEFITPIVKLAEFQSGRRRRPTITPGAKYYKEGRSTLPISRATELRFATAAPTTTTTSSGLRKEMIEERKECQPAKVIFTCFERNDKKEVKVEQLAALVAKESAYHHGEECLQATIVNMAQDFVGSNNINLLKPNGQFGTRLTGGKDAASARYIFTMLSPLARKIFPVKDDPLMKYLYDDNLRIEPEYYVPIIPMVLVNGAEGIGTGWSTKIPNYNPRVLAENVKRRLRGEKLLPLEPWYKGFKGTFTQVEPKEYVVSGEAVMRSSTSFDITELPIHKWTQPYRDTVLEPMLSLQNGQGAPLLTDVRSNCTDETVQFTVEMTAENLQKVAAGIHSAFKLQTTISTNSMVLFDGDGCLRRFDSPKEIFDAFFPVRMKLYEERKRYYEGLLQAEVLFLDNQVRFIREMNGGIIKMEKVKEAALTRQLIARNYDSDPVKAWKRQYAPEDEAKKKKDGEENDAEEEDSAEKEEEKEEGNEEEEKKVGVCDFNYLLDLPMRRMLLEHAEQLIKTRDDKHAELTKLQQTTPAQLWVADIDDFLATLDEVEKKKGGGDDDDALKLQTAAAAGVPPARGERVQPSTAATSAAASWLTAAEQGAQLCTYSRRRHFEGANEKVQVKKEEEDSETDFDAPESVDQLAGNESQSAESVVKTEDQNEFQIDMFDDEFHLIMEQDFSAETNANGTNDAVNEEHETDSDAAEIDDDDHSAVSGE